jgi:hypothetical protein
MFFAWALVIGLVMLITRIRRSRNGSDV